MAPSNSRVSAATAPVLALLLCCSCVAGLHVAVTGPTGRTGRLVVDELLRNGHTVTAIMRNTTKGSEVLPVSDNVACKQLDLATADGAAMAEACSGVDALIWAATGFSETGESLDIRGFESLVPAAFPPPPSSSDSTPVGPPKVVMLSSAGVTRPAWSDEKKEKLIGAADIPIIRLNPGGVS